MEFFSGAPASITFCQQSKDQQGLEQNDAERTENAPFVEFPEAGLFELTMEPSRNILFTDIPATKFDANRPS